jgi:hypothetical protein
MSGTRFDHEKGMWVMETGPHNPRSAQELKKDRRIFTGEDIVPPVPIGPYDIRNLEEHVRGRAEAGAQVMIQLAFLRSKRLVNDSEVVSCTGAVYQDARGESEYPRSHRLPCNPMIGIFTLPELCGFRHPALAARITLPLAKTDPLLLLANYADGLFEKCGPYETMAEAVREVILEQPRGREVNHNLIRHVISYSLLPGFQQAYEVARQKSLQTSDEEFAKLVVKNEAPFSQATLQRMQQLSLTMEMDSNKPAQNRQGAQDILLISATVASKYQPRLILPDEIAEETECLKSLAGSEAAGANA